MTDLVERLRIVEPDAPGSKSYCFRNPDGPEAADEIERLRATLDQTRRFALNGEMDTIVSDEIERLREALRRVRTAIFNAKPEVLTDTLWMHDRLGETVVDCIDDALNDYDWEVLARTALGEKE